MRAVITGAVLAATLCAAPPSAAAGDVTIRRTAHGVPHIRATDFRSLGYGIGYAFARDNACSLLEDVVTVRGERSRFFGPDRSYRSNALSVEFNNLDSDFFFTQLNASRRIERLLLQDPPRGPSRRARAVAEGYAAGFNHYVQRVGARRLPAPCRNAAWVRPITALDVHRRLYQLAIFASSGFFLSGIAQAAPPQAGAPPASLVPARLPDRLPPGALPRSDTLGLGSNAIALGREATRNGRGLLLANPHFPWEGSERFYEMHLTIPGRLDVFGAGLFGVPAVNIGHTAGVAWSHTVSTAYRFTPVELRLAPGDPTSYVVDGTTEPMTTQDVTVMVAGPSGGLEPRTRRLYSTRYGPLVHAPDLFLTWGTATAYALHDANADNVRLLDQFLAMDAAQDVAGLRRAQDRWQAIPWVNTLAADRGGTAYYADQSVVPHVTDAQVEQCVTSPVGRALLALARLPVLDGSRSACDWGRDADAVVPGIFGPGRLPRLERADYVANSNDSHWLSNPRRPLVGFPSIIGTEATQRSTRTRLALKMIEGRLSGDDGLGPAGFTPALLRRIALNNRNHTGELLRDDLVTMCRRSPVVVLADGRVVDIAEACPVLERWDLRGDLDSRGAALWRLFLAGVLNTAEPFWANEFDPEDPVGTPNGLNPANVEVLQSLGAAVQALRDKGIALHERWGNVFHASIQGERIPMHGCDGAEGCFNAMGAYNQPDPFRVDLGASFVMTTGFADEGPETHALLAYSQSTSPDSPYRSDQTGLLAAKRWPRIPFRRRDVRRAATGRTLRFKVPSAVTPG